MTAEVAIMNKTAVALAADSAVTLSVGSDQRKVFDSEDKLFELSRRDPIGVMINNNMQFMEAPLPVLIKRYRGACPRFDRVEEAAQAFLTHLMQFGADSPAVVVDRNVRGAVVPLLKFLGERAEKKLVDRLFGPDADPQVLTQAGGYDEFREVVYREQVEVVRRFVEEVPETTLIGPPPSDEPADLQSIITEEMANVRPTLPDSLQDEIADLVRLSLTRRLLMAPHTGVVFAGFGRNDLFPTLISYEIFGMVGGQLRVFQTNHEDVDRGGTRAKVIPFAQKEMVERFLYGLDDGIQRRITAFCKGAVPRIRERISEGLVMDEGDRAAFEAEIIASEEAFFKDLHDEAFQTLRDQSQLEIEEMVEFMPKVEMGRMAEALVNLTSIKRRVSRGMETVGGPIDVAVISRSDGFVWVKRKHYFPPELNNRFFDRMRDQPQPSGGQ
jgi:hypothetical protein